MNKNKLENMDKRVMANKNKEIEDKQRSREAVTKGLLLIEIIPRNREDYSKIEDPKDRRNPRNNYLIGHQSGYEETWKSIDNRSYISNPFPLENKYKY